MGFIKIMKGHWICDVCRERDKGLRIKILGKTVNAMMCLSCLHKALVDPDAAVDHEAWRKKIQQEIKERE